jgi:hypothetical protein
VLAVNGEILARDLSDEQKRVLDEVEVLLKPTAKAQRLLEGDKYPTISLVPFFLHRIRHQYETMVTDESLSSPVRSLAKKLLEDFEKRYLKRSEPVFAVQVRRERGRYVGIPRETVLASALDPRTKRLNPFIPEPEHDTIWREVFTMMVDVKEAAVAIDTPPVYTPTVGVATAVDDVSGRPVQQARILLNEDDDDDDDDLRNQFHELIQYEQQDASNDRTQSRDQIELSCRDELLRYKQEVSLAMFRDGTNDFSDPLQWWEEHKNRYPTIYVLSQRFLSIPATSAPSERLWSLASRIITIRRARLDSTVLGDLMFIKENSSIMKKHYYDITGEKRILPLVYPAGDGDVDDVDSVDVGA